MTVKSKRTFSCILKYLSITIIVVIIIIRSSIIIIEEAAECATFLAPVFYRHSPEGTTSPSLFGRSDVDFAPMWTELNGAIRVPSSVIALSFIRQLQPFPAMLQTTLVSSYRPLSPRLGN